MIKFVFILFFHLSFRIFSNEDDPLEFFLQLIYQLLAAITYAAIYAGLCACFIGLFTYIEALIVDFGNVVSELDESVAKENVRNNDSNTQNILNELILLHINILG